MKSTGFTKEYVCSIYSGKNIIDFENLFSLMQTYLTNAGFNVEYVVETDPIFGGNVKVLYVGTKWSGQFNVDNTRYAILLRDKYRAGNSTFLRYNITIVSYLGETLIDTLNQVRDPTLGLLESKIGDTQLTPIPLFNGNYIYNDTNWNAFNCEKVRVNFYANGHTGVIWALEEYFVKDLATLEAFYEPLTTMVSTSMERPISDMEKRSISRSIFVDGIYRSGNLSWAAIYDKNSALTFTKNNISTGIYSQNSSTNQVSFQNLPGQQNIKQFLPIYVELDYDPEGAPILGKINGIYMPNGDFSYKEEIGEFIVTLTKNTSDKYLKTLTNSYGGRGLALPRPKNGFIVEA